MKRGSTLFLKIALIIIGIPVLAVCILLLPQLAYEALVEAKKGAELAYVIIGILIILYGSAIPFYFALYQAFRLLKYIDNNQAFSHISVRALKKIKKCGIIISGLFVCNIPSVVLCDS